MEEEKILSAEESAEYVEFKRSKREAEIFLTLKRLVIDASRRDTDRAALRRACDTALRLRATSVQVSPVNVVRARRQLQGEVPVCCIVGGTGESLIAIKRMEARKALRQGAGEIKLILCRSALASGNLSYLKREIRRIRRIAKRRTLVVSLEDKSLTEEELLLGVKACCLARADGISVCGETAPVLSAAEACAGKIFVEATGVENSEQLRLLIKAGASRALSAGGERIMEELYSAIKQPNVSRKGENTAR